MRLKKFLDYLTSKFSTNARYTSSIFYTLKFFFEKNTKHFHVLDELGIVYRSSKWVSLKLRNINSTPLFKWFTAAAIGLMLCYVVVNPSGLVPTVVTSAVHTFNQSAWQLLQYWKVCSMTVLVSTVKLWTQLLLKGLVRWVTPNRSQSALYATTQPTPGSRAQEPDASIVGKEYHYLAPSTSTQSYVNWTSRQQPILPWVTEFYKLQKALSQSSISFQGLRLRKSHALLYGLLPNRYYSQPVHPTSLPLYMVVSSFLDEPATELPHTTEATYAICQPHAAHSAQNLSRAIFSTPLDQSTLWRLTASSERSVLSNLGANLALSKENRWLWRSNMFSNRLSAQLNSLAQMRTYINNPLFSSLFLNKSIWLSTRVSGSADLQLLNLSDCSSASSIPLLARSGGKGIQNNLNFLGDSILWNLSRFSMQQSMHSMQHTTFTPAGGVTRVRPNSPSTGFCFPRVNPLFLDYRFVTGDLFLVPSTNCLAQPYVSWTSKQRPVLPWALPYYCELISHSTGRFQGLWSTNSYNFWYRDCLQPTRYEYPAVFVETRSGRTPEEVASLAKGSSRGFFYLGDLDSIATSFLYRVFSSSFYQSTDELPDLSEIYCAISQSGVACSAPNPIMSVFYDFLYRDCFRPARTPLGFNALRRLISPLRGIRVPYRLFSGLPYTSETPRAISQSRVRVARSASNFPMTIFYTPLGLNALRRLTSYPDLGRSALYSLFSDLTFSKKNSLIGPKTTAARLEGFDSQILLRRDVATLLSGCFASAPKKSLPFIYFSNL